MSSRILVIDESRDPTEVVSRVLPSVYRRTKHRVAPPGQTLLLETFDDGFGLWTYWLPASRVNALVDALKDEYVEVHHYRVEAVPGTGGKQIDASYAVSQDGVMIARDISSEAEELAEEWSDGRRIDDALEDELTHALLEVLPEQYVTIDTEELFFELTVSKRVAPLVAALEEGATWQEVELYGQQAIKVTRDGESQISVLKPDELKELEPWLVQGG